jgi:hypothetical protein
MTQFIELELVGGQPRRVNIAAIAQYYRINGHTHVRLFDTEAYDVRQDVGEIDLRIRNTDKRAIISQG